MDDGCGPSWSPDTNRSQNVEQDDELTIPRAAINKMIKEILPNIRVANEARELVLSCCTEFIHLVSSESNEVCNQQQKKTISAEHVLSALNRLGFADFVKEAEEVLSECKESAAKRRRQSTRLENLGIPEAELLRQQQELFARAREQQQLNESGMTTSPLPPPPAATGSQSVPQPGSGLQQPPSSGGLTHHSSGDLPPHPPEAPVHHQFPAATAGGALAVNKPFL